MHSKIKNTYYYCFIIILPLYLLASFDCSFARPFFSESTLIIDSEYSGRLHQNFGEKATWHLIFEPKPSGFSIQYKLNGNNTFCTLDLNEENEFANFTLINSKGKNIDTASISYIPFQGIPAPCRILPENFTKIDTFKILQQAGNRKFSNQYTIEKEPVTLEDVFLNKWVDVNTYDQENNERKLYFIFVKKNNQLIFKQLWEENSTWWLYEETTNSKSWRR